MKSRVTRIGWVLMALIAAGVVVFFLASRVIAAVGAAVALLALMFIVADQLPAGLGGGWMVGKGRRGMSSGRSRREPEYIARTVEPSEQVWAREQERMREKGQDQT